MNPRAKIFLIEVVIGSIAFALANWMTDHDYRYPAFFMLWVISGVMTVLLERWHMQQTCLDK